MMVLDAAALLAYLEGSPAGEVVAGHLEHGAIISHLSLLEVAKALPEVSTNRLLTVLEQTGIGLRSIEERHLPGLIKSLRAGESLEQASVTVLARVTGYDRLKLQDTPNTNGGADARPA